LDKNTQATLHRRKFGQADRMTTSGRMEDLVRQFKSVSPSKREEYSIMVGGTEYGPHEIDGLAKKLQID
jgi:hypothetical protein